MVICSVFVIVNWYLGKLLLIGLEEYWLWKISNVFREVGIKVENIFLEFGVVVIFGIMKKIKKFEVGVFNILW